jgi:hypothetical protein
VALASVTKFVGAWIGQLGQPYIGRFSFPE